MIYIINTIINNKLKKEKVLRDPIHNYVYVQDQIILDLINSKEFQRLRRVKQLGTTCYTFHGAEHSRFSHSVGVYEIARKICNLFKHDYASHSNTDGLWKNNETLLTLCAALLHDVGHGAYSHTFEHIFHTNHEKMTQMIILSPETEINQILKKVSNNFPEKVAKVINKTYFNKQVVQIISSQIDADRMDYLLRDSYFTGTNYGNFDLTRILRVMKPYNNQIVFDFNGMHAIEDYIISRFQMYQQVYFHPTSISMEIILNSLLKRAKKLYFKNKLENNFATQTLKPFFENNFTLNEYLNIDDGVLETCFMIWQSSNDEILRDLSDRFLNRKPFKSVIFNKNSQKVIKRMKYLIKKAGFNPQYYSAVNYSFDLPYDLKFNKLQTQITLIKEDATLYELSSVSPLVHSISDKTLGNERFFFPEQMLNTNYQLEIFNDIYAEFQKHIHNNNLIE